MAVTLHIAQFEWQCRLVYIAQLLAEIRLMLRFADTQTRLGHIVAIRHGGLRRTRLAAQMGEHFLTHDFQRSGVHHNVMEQQCCRQARTGRVRAVGQTDQRRTAQVHACRTRRGVDLRHWHTLDKQIRLAPDHLLRRLQPIPDDRRTQTVVPGDDFAQGSGHRLKTLLTVDVHAQLQQVRVALLGSQMVIEDAFLQGRQRVDFLNIGRAARHCGDNVLNGRLVEL